MSAQLLASWLPKLASLELHYHSASPTEACIICIRCGFAIATGGEQVTRHLQEKHHVPKRDRAGLSAFIRTLQLPDPRSIRPWPDGSRPHPRLAQQKGFACRSCGLRSVSIKVLSQHLHRDHGYGIYESQGCGEVSTLKGHIEYDVVFQSWTGRDTRRSWLVKPEGPVGTPPPSPNAVAKEGPARNQDKTLRAFAERIALEEKNYLEMLPKYNSGREAASAITSTPPPSLVSSWLRRTGRIQLFDGANRRLLFALTRLPSTTGRAFQIIDSAGQSIYDSPIADEQKLSRIVMAVDWLMDRCHDTLHHTDVSIRRWLRSKLYGRPFKAPFQPVTLTHSEKMYRAEFKRYLCFYLRISNLPTAAFRSILGRHKLAQSQTSSLHTLWTDSIWTDPYWDNLSSSRIEHMTDEIDSERDSCPFEEDEDENSEQGIDDEADSDYGQRYCESPTPSERSEGVEAEMRIGMDSEERQQGILAPCTIRDHAIGILLRFGYFSFGEEFVDGTASSTLLIYFAAVRGLSSKDDQFLYPHQYTPILARLIYIARLICLEALLPRFAHQSVGIPARPRLGQLQRLNETRHHIMCDGTASPLGELLSLLAYGCSLRRCTIPSFCFEWSDDGQEISWDGDNQLTMDAFRGLSRSILHAASQCCRRLLFDWEPDITGMGQIRDRLSDVRLGYSFLSDPANRLGDRYLMLVERACLSSMRGLLKRDSTSAGSWDFTSVRAYVRLHDDFLRMLMVLLHTTGGKGSRISELLSLEHSNTAFQPRGLCFYRGRLISITRHHKVRLWTNNEFQVARFYPDAVSHLAYCYIVYIRPLTNMLLRKCLQRPPLGSLLFEPAASSAPWTTNTFTRELRQLASTIPGFPPGIGAQLYRQLCTAIAVKHVHPAATNFNRHDPISAYGQQDSISAWQSGHTSLRQATTYGLDGAYHAHLQPTLLALYEDISRQWHAFLGFDQDGPARQATCTCSHATQNAHQPPQEAPLRCAQKRRYEVSVPDSSPLLPVEPQASEKRASKRSKVLPDPPIDAQPRLSSTTPSILLDDRATIIQMPPMHTRQALPQVPRTMASPRPSPFVHLHKLHVLVCTLCQFAVLADEIMRHLDNPRHKGSFSRQEKRMLSEKIQSIPGVMKTQSDLAHYALPRPDAVVIPYLCPPAADGIGCDRCAYVCRTRQGMQFHYKTAHGWVNPRGRGRARPDDESADPLWESDVLCQRLFLNRAASGWFRVCR